MKAKHVIVFIIIGVFISVSSMWIGAAYLSESNTTLSKQEDSHKEETVWTCSMHPQFKLPKKGKCPICAMDLIPLEKGSGNKDEATPSIEFSPYAQKLASVETFEVSTRNNTVNKDLLGELVWDERMIKTESAWFNGRIEKLNISYTGQYVKKGQVIAEIYSPELYAAVQEWKIANNSSNEVLKNSVTTKLKLLGINPDDIDYLSSINSERVKHRALNSGVVVKLNVKEGQYIKTGEPYVQLGSTRKLWVELNVFEKDIAGIKKGHKVSLQTESVPGKLFEAKVEFIHPILDKNTRTVKIRLSLWNRDGVLKPGMLVQAKLSMDQSEEKLVIPETAPLITGKRALVYLEIKPGVYSGRTVGLGDLNDGYYEVMDGLEVGDIVVSRGAFKIDAAMQIQGLPTMMYPENINMENKNVALGQDGEEKMLDGEKKMSLNTPIKLTKKGEKWLGQFYEVYLKLQHALANDDLSESNKAMTELASILDKTPDVFDKKYARHYVGAYEKAVASNNIDNLRKEMVGVSELAIQWLRRSEFKPKQGARVYYCSMANDSKGAEWLQTDGDVNNPYYGEMMLRCGEKRTILSHVKGVVK